MGKKRLVLEIDESQHRMLVNEARGGDMTLSNYIRSRLGLPLERQGVKTSVTTSSTQAKKAKKRK